MSEIQTRLLWLHDACMLDLRQNSPADFCTRHFANPKIMHLCYLYRANAVGFCRIRIGGISLSQGLARITMRYHFGILKRSRKALINAMRMSQSDTISEALLHNEHIHQGSPYCPSTREDSPMPTAVGHKGLFAHQHEGL